MPPAFTSLSQSLPKGFVVLLNVSELAHHALIMEGGSGSAYSLELKLPSRVVGSKHEGVQNHFSRDATRTDVDAPDDDELPDITRKDEGLRAAAVRERLIRTLEISLADLWTSIVKPVLDVLQLKVSWTAQSPINDDSLLTLYGRGLMVATGLGSGGVPPATSRSFPFTLLVTMSAERESFPIPVTNAHRTTWFLPTRPAFCHSREPGALQAHCRGTL
jgi:hypothetical protein